MSRESITRYKKKEQSSSDQSLPEEWTSVQKRLDYLETSMVKMQKRSQKLQKKIEQQNEQMISFRRDTRKLIQEVFNDQKNVLATREKQLEFENMKAELEDLHNYIKRVDKKSSEIIKEVKSNASGGLSDSCVDERIEEKVEIIFERHQKDINRVVAELKQMVKDVARDQNPIERRSNQNILTNSRSRQALQKSAQKSQRASYTELAINQDVSIDHKQQKPKSPQPLNNASSRVNYLKEKLKEFQETNRKFQQKFDRKSPPHEQKKTVQKLKDFKNYLEQSQSQLDQSNLQLANPHNVLSESIKNWRNGDRYRYE